MEDFEIIRILLTRLFAIYKFFWGDVTKIISSSLYERLRLNN